MGQYNKAIITAVGESLIARAVAGEIQWDITKAKTSDYKYPDGTDFKALTDMQGVKQVMNSPETKVLSSDLIQTRTLFNNEEIEATYYIHNIGLYAMDGAQEVLFCIVTASIPDEMPQYNGVASTSYIYNIQSAVQDAAELNVTVHPSGTATIQDVMERVDATGGDISSTVVETLETIDTKYPIPTAGEKVKTFFGKIITFMKGIKPLEADVAYYVATTGSDLTGDGTQAKPYKTIQRAVDILPKDLNGYTATIQVAAGTYGEDVKISSLHGGMFQLYSSSKDTLAGTCIVKSITMRYCKGYMMVNGFAGTQVEDAPFVVSRCHYASILYCQSTISARTKAGIYISESSSAVSGCRIANRNVALQVITSNVFSDNWDRTGSVNNDYGLSSNRGSIITTTGNQPEGTVSTIQSVGGAFIKDNGTQISGMITSGLSCTWGTITGGYVRNGNLNGAAMITVTIQVITTIQLSSGQQYNISGSPVPSTGVPVAVASNASTTIISWLGYTNGVIGIIPTVNVASNTILQFNVTYPTNN